MGDTNRQLLLEKMKRRRAAMEASIASDVGSYKSDTEDTLRRTQTSAGAALSPASADTTTEIETLGPGTDTVVETLEDVGQEEDMLQDLQARRQQKKEEIQRTMDSSGGAWGEPVQSPGPATLSTGDNESPGPGFQRVEGRRLSESATTQSLNLNASIRDRLRSKVRGRQTRTPLQETIPERRLRGLRDRPLPTRFDDAGLLAPGQELGEQEQGAELQASIASVNRWKKIGLLSKQKVDGMPSEEEAYNFFVGSMEETPEEQPAEGTSEEPVEVPEGDNLTFWGKPPYMGLAKQLEEEDKLYMIPSLRPVPLDQKVPEGQNPRCWEEEGFYVGKPPQVAYTNLNIMEHRLNENCKELWFGEDGQLKRLANPVKEKPSRPPLITTEEPEELLETEWIKAVAEPFDGKFIDGTGDQRNQYQLDVDVSTLNFLHHPLFSREHVLASRLTQLYKQFCQRRQKAVSAHLTDKVQALKITLQQLQDNAGNLGKLKTKSTVTDVRKRIQEYRKQVIETRDLRDAEDRFDRKLLVNILNCWRDIKLLRDQQGHVNTPVKIVVRKEKTNKEEDERFLEEELGEELQERREEHEAEYQEMLATYENELRDWKRLMKRRKKRLEQRATEEGEESTLVNEDEPAPARPAKPEEFDEAVVYTELKEKANKCCRRPGEPILSPELHHSVSITPLDQCPRPEKLRRQEAQNWTCFVKVLFNDKEVSRTSTKRLTSEFSIHFGEIHNIRIVQWPESIKLQVIDAGMQSKLVADVYLPIPETTVVSSRVELVSQEFSSSSVVTYKHEGVGSGTEFEPVITANNEEQEESRPPQTLLTSGTLMSSASWAVDSDGMPLAPPLYNETNISMVKRYDAMAALGAAGIVDIQKLSKWIAESHLDPNDPANANIMSIMKIGKTQWEGGEGPQYFRVNQLEEETELVTRVEMNRSKRFKLIQLRDQGVPEFKNYKMVPSRDRDIPDNIFETYEKRQRGDEEETQEDEIPSHRAAVTKFLNKVREEVTKRSLIAKRQLKLKDMIVEDEVPDIGTLGIRIGQLFAPRRPLRPVRRERKIVGAQNLTVSDVKVLINVVRAVDVPVRMESQQTVSPRGGRSGFGTGTSTRRDQFSASTSGYGGPSAGTQSTGTAVTGGAQIRPFVEAVFQGNFARTSVAESANPSWNEELVLPFRAPNNDYSPENLQTVNDVVYLNLFDEIVIDILQDDRLRTTNVHQRLERHWLGGIEIPFSTIYFNNKVEGTLKVNTPPVLLGYRHQGRGGVQAVQGVASRNDTLLTLFATIEPPLQPSQQMPERFESNEEDKLLHNSQLWLEPLKKKFPKREFKLLATDLNGKKVFVTRYIRPQKPPEDLLVQSQEPQQMKEMERIARFVSLIPYVSDSAAFPDLCDIWATSDQFLLMLAGDEEEHAILLCNYFRYRNRTAYVVLGTGIPEGSTAYVLTVDDGYRLWNAYTGEHFDVHDANCPLKSIGCVFNEENLWANIQEWEEPYRLSYDLSRPKHWQPFFSKKYPRPSLTSVQKEYLQYKEIDQDYVKSVQEKIEKTLRDKIMSWRPRFVTRWNRYCNQAFRNMLNSIELNLGHRLVENHSPELDQILASYKLSGFPINMSFTDVGPVLESVFSTGVHTTEDPDVEFALAVHIHPYPHGVLSLWVYVGTLRRKVGY